MNKIKQDQTKNLIKQLKDQGLKQKEIGEKIGWSKGKVDNYSALMTNILEQVLDFAKDHQKDRSSPNLNSSSFNFTRGWFYKSGLYDLNKEYQLKTLQSFVDDKCKWSKQKQK